MNPVVPVSEVIFETERFVVRWYREGDGAHAFTIYGDPEVWRFLGNGTHEPHPNAEHTERALLAGAKRNQQRTDGLGLWVIEERATNTIVGTVGLVSSSDDEVELVYHLARAHWGRGIATEAGRGAIEHGFTRLHLNQVTGFVHQPNVASIRVLEKLGFARTGKAEYEGAALWRFQLDRAS